MFVLVYVQGPKCLRELDMLQDTKNKIMVRGMAARMGT